MRQAVEKMLVFFILNEVNDLNLLTIRGASLSRINSLF